MTPSPTEAALYKRSQAFQVAHAKLAKYCKLLALSSEVECRADEIYEQAYNAKLKRTDNFRAFMAACIFLACRQQKVSLVLGSMFTHIDAPITKTIESLWYLEDLVDGRKVHPDEIIVTYERCNSLLSPSSHGPPPIEAHIAWHRGPKAVVPAKLNTGSPSLRLIIARETQRQAEMLLKDTATRQEHSDEGVKQSGLVAMDLGNDWDVIDWEDEQKREKINSDEEIEKYAQAKGWTGILRRGIFG